MDHEQQSKGAGDRPFVINLGLAIAACIGIFLLTVLVYGYTDGNVSFGPSSSNNAAQTPAVPTSQILIPTPSPAPAPQPVPQKKAVLPEIATSADKGSCNLQNELNSAKEWIHACYLRDLLTTQCKQLFDINGYYVTDNPYGYVSLYDYLDNADICNCRLPTDVASRLNSDQSYTTAQCNKLPSL